jgi:GH25 family lysozyme M1 (1,4-beta-N-acetylmuramidase)
MDNAIGVDVSYYEVKWGDPVYGEYWKPEAAIKPIDFCIQRASYGLAKDKCLDFLYERSTSQIKVKGFYHYFSSWSNYKYQMDNFLKAVEDKEYQFLAVDYEGYGNTLDNRTFAEMCEMVKQLKVITGKKVLTYFNPNIYSQYMKPFGAGVVIGSWDVWLASYPTMSNWDNYVFPTKFPATGTPVLFHQAGGGDVAGTIGVVSGYNYGSWRKGIDLNVFNGTKAQLYNWAGVDSTPVEPPIVVPPIIVNPNEFAITVNQLNVRVGPGVAFTKLGYVVKTDKITILEYKRVGSEIWGRISMGWVCLFLGGVCYTTKTNFSDVPVLTVPPVENGTPCNLYVFTRDAYWLRPDGGPLITPTFSETKTSSKKEILLNASWTNWIKTQLSNSAKAYEKIVSKYWGPSKGFNNNGLLVFNSSVYPGRNVVKIKKILTGIDGQKWGEVECIPMSAGIPANVNYLDKPHLVHTVYGSNSKWSWFSLGADAPKVPILQDDTPKYVEMKWLTSVDAMLPKVVKVTASPALNVRDIPNGNIVTRIPYGITVTVSSIQIGYGGLWGKVPGGYIALRSNNVNYTDWAI